VAEAASTAALNALRLADETSAKLIDLSKAIVARGAINNSLGRPVPSDLEIHPNLMLLELTDWLNTQKLKALQQPGATVFEEAVMCLKSRLEALHNHLKERQRLQSSTTAAQRTLLQSALERSLNGIVTTFDENIDELVDIFTIDVDEEQYGLTAELLGVVKAAENCQEACQPNWSHGRRQGTAACLTVLAASHAVNLATFAEAIWQQAVQISIVFGQLVGPQSDTDNRPTN
jgi:hypothetical protein